jgi:hypothetical protein
MQTENTMQTPKKSAEASEFAEQGEFLPKKKVKSIKKKGVFKKETSGSILNQVSSHLLAAVSQRSQESDQSQVDLQIPKLQNVARDDDSELNKLQQMQVHIRRGLDATPQILEKIDEMGVSRDFASTQKVKTELMNTEIAPAEKTVILSKNASKSPTLNPSTYNVTRNSHFEGSATLANLDLKERPEMMKTSEYQQAMV